MADNGHDMDRLRALLDRHGSSFEVWPDRNDAQWARALVMASPEGRRAYEAARHLDRLLDERSEAFEDDALAERIAASATSALPRTGETRRWVGRLAASFLLAALFGGAFERVVLTPTAPEPTEMAMLDSLLYGPEETDLP